MTIYYQYHVDGIRPTSSSSMSSSIIMADNSYHHDDQEDYTKGRRSLRFFKNVRAKDQEDCCGGM